MVVGNGYGGLVKLYTVVLAACCWEGLAPIPPSPLVCLTDIIPMHILLSTAISHGVKVNFTFQQIDRLALPLRFTLYIAGINEGPECIFGMRER